MITKLTAKNYGCLKDVEVDLTPVHAFIGPNDSGKSTLLRAVRTLACFAAGQFDFVNQNWSPFDPDLDPREKSPAIQLRATIRPHPEENSIENMPLGIYGVDCTHDSTVETFQDLGIGGTRETADRSWNRPTGFRQAKHAILENLHFARLLRLDPDALRQPSGLIPHTEAVHFLDERGRGLPGVYQAILGRGDDAFAEIRERVKALFPSIARLGVLPITANQLMVEAELTDGTRITADRLSEGLLYFLAFAAISYLNPTSVLMVEEPENGLHPARVKKVVRALRDFSTTTKTQVLIATHSPLVIDELNADEVTVLTRPSAEKGTRAVPIKNTRNFEKRASTYSLGELWLAYCDGNQEEPLFNPRLR